LLSEEVLCFRFGYDPFALFDICVRGEPGATSPALFAVRLLFDAVEVTDSASEPRRALDLLFAIRAQFQSFLPFP
jgi:hypothetical protein